MTREQLEALERVLAAVNVLLPVGVSIAGLLVDDGQDEPKLIEQHYDSAIETAEATKEKVRLWREQHGL